MSPLDLIKRLHWVQPHRSSSVLGKTKPHVTYLVTLTSLTKQHVEWQSQASAYPHG